MIMRCKEIKENLIFFIEGSLNHDRAMQIQKHLEECQECKSSYLKLKSVLSIIETEKIKESNPYFSMKVLERLKYSSETSKVFSAFKIIRILKPVVAIFLIGIAIYTGILMGGSFSHKYDTIVIDDSRGIQLQAVADEFYLNDLGIENIETILITYNK